MKYHYHERTSQLTPALLDELDALMRSVLGDVFPAAALVILQKGQRMFEATWGWLDPETEQIPVTPDSLFDLASVSKLFTATTFLSFVSEGRVGLDDPLVTLIPEFGVSGVRPMDGGQDPFTRELLPVAPEYHDRTIDPALVTFRHLLTHTSGLAPWRAIFRETGPIPPPPGQPDSLDRQTRWENGLRLIYGCPFVDVPGKAIHYSDLGFILLGETVSRLQGEPFDIALQKRLLDPLGLTSVVYNPLQHGHEREHIIPTEDDPWRGRRLWGEVDDENTAGLGGVSGHAGLFAAVRDVAAFGQAWLFGDSRLGINPATLAEAVRQQAVDTSERRGLGWQLQHAASPAALNPRAFGHTGFTGTSLWIDPQRSLVVACLTNRVYMGRHKPGIETFRPALHNLLARYFAEER